MSGNDLLTRSIKAPFTTDWMYILNNAGTQEGRATIADILALSTDESNTSSNAGAGAQLAKAKLGVDLPFRSLVSADGSVEFIENTDEINIKALRVGIYKNISITAGAMISQSTDGATAGTNATSNVIMNDFYDFADGVDEFIQFSMEIDDAWDLGNLNFKFYWGAGAVTGAGDVSWTISAYAVSNGQSFNFNFPTASVIADTFVSPSDMHITSAVAATAGNTPALQDIIYFRIGRSGITDSYTETARLFGASIQYKEGTTEPAAWV